MEAKVKEEVADKDYQPNPAERRKSTSTNKDRRSPDEDESLTSPTPAPHSPQNNGTTGTLSDSVSPPLAEGSRSVPALHRLKRFLSALLQFANDVGADTGERVKQHIYNVIGGSMTVEEFQLSIQESTNYPLRASVPGFLRTLLPHAQRDLQARARLAKQTPLAYIRAHEHLILETSGDGDIFATTSQPCPEGGLKRRISDAFYDGGLPQTNGSHHGVVDPIDYPPPNKRPPPSLFINPSPFLCPLPTGNMFDYGHPYHPGYNNPVDNTFERRDGGISVRDVQSMNATFSDGRGSMTSSGPGHQSGFKCDDEWKNINTMLNCILSMVEKTKRALAILQQRGMEPSEHNDIKRAANEIMASAVRQTEERVADVRRRAEDAVNQVKRQALIDLQRAVGAAETKALELVAAERTKMERLLADRRSSPPPGSRDISPSPGTNSQQNCCWNCGRKAQETCSGCNAARYCGSFCQHKDWENHHQVCSGREPKPAAILTTSPPMTQTTTLTKSLARSTTPITSSTDRHPISSERHTAPSSNERHAAAPENRLSLTSLNNAERMLANNPERTITAANTERIALASLSTAQGLLGGIGGKK